MAIATLGGHVYDIPPFGFKKLRKSAPLIDRIQKLSEEPGTMVNRMEMVDAMLAVLAIGIDDSLVTADTLTEVVSIEEINGLESTFQQLMDEARGGAKAPPPGEETPAGAGDPSTNNSMTSSLNSAPAASAAAIGIG